MTLEIPFDNSYGRLPTHFYTRLTPVPVKAPDLIAFNQALAAELGVIPGPQNEMAQAFAGNIPPQGADPLAQVYAGHQFGGFSPQLGDGRAVLLGEVVGRGGMRRDIQLKGSGPTPYSRMGDGRAWLGPVLREYVVSEAMHAMSIPTSRALAAVSTGEAVYRETGALPGAILTRVASSHIRVGTFQYFAARRDTKALQALYEYSVARHYPEVSNPTQFISAVTARQAQLVAKWMAVGFIHGVMNTDNTTISGETIDYGPCAFMDEFHPTMVFSSIDVHGRYAYDAQANVIVWNMAQLATSLIPLMPDQDAAVEEFTQVLNTMQGLVSSEWLAAFGAKIGIADAGPDDEPLITGLLQIMADNRADFTNTFRALITGNARNQFVNPAAFDDWEKGWRERLKSETDTQARMTAANPAFIPRNHRVEQMIDAAVEGNFDPFNRLLNVMSRPFDNQPDANDLMHPPEPSEVVQQTFCGT